MYRMYIACVFLLPVIILKRKALKLVYPSQFSFMAIAGIFLGIHFGLWFQSLKYTSVTNSTIILSLQPIVAMIGSYLIYKEKANFKTVLAIIISIIGVIFVSWGDFGNSNPLALLGDLLSFLSVISLVTYLLIGQSKVKGISFWIYSFFVFLSAGISLNVYNIAANVKITGFSSNDWIIFISLAIFPTIAHIIYNYLLNHISTTAISMSTLGEPLGATILAVIFLNEKLIPIQIIGGIIVIIGVFLFLKQQ